MRKVPRHRKYEEVDLATPGCTDNGGNEDETIEKNSIGQILKSKENGNMKSQ